MKYMHIRWPQTIQYSLPWASKLCMYSVYGKHQFYVKSLRVLSTPHVSIHGCVGWNSQSRTPMSFRSVELWQRSIFTGTINGFCVKSLQTTKMSLQVNIHLRMNLRFNSRPISKWSSVRRLSFGFSSTRSKKKLWEWVAVSHHVTQPTVWKHWRKQNTDPNQRPDLIRSSSTTRLLTEGVPLPLCWLSDARPVPIIAHHLQTAEILCYK